MDFLQVIFSVKNSKIEFIKQLISSTFELYEPLHEQTRLIRQKTPNIYSNALKYVETHQMIPRWSF